VNLPARAAAIRGDDYQHVIGLYHACRALGDPDIESVSVEDSSGGAFDDVVIRMRPESGQRHQYIQVKSSNYNNQVVNEDWLLKAQTRKGRSPLQHFHDTWSRLIALNDPHVLTLMSNRNFDHDDPLLALIDNGTNRISRATLDNASPKTDIGKAVARWAGHLGVDAEELKKFVTEVRLERGEGDQSWEARCRPLMKDAGLRDDAEAVTVGRAMVHGWVTSGAGPRTRDDIRAEITSKNLLARGGTLVLAVHAIDRVPTADLPNITVDFVDLYPGAEAFQRRQLTDPSAWNSQVLPRLAAARDELCTFKSRRVHIVGSMRLPVYFAIGRTLPDVGRWVLSVDQRGQEWTTDANRRTAELSVLADERLSDQGDLAVALALTHDPTNEVRIKIEGAERPTQRLLVLSSPGGPSQTSVEDPGWAADWVSQARECVRAAVDIVTDRHVRLFLACPAAVAMFAGHQWNLVPTTTVYEHQNPGYEPTMILPG
jgi:SMODS-associated and fused to various effectors sensor domain